MIADFVEDYPALAAFTAVLVLLLIVMGIVLRVWFRRRRAEARRRLPPRAPRPDPKALILRAVPRDAARAEPPVLADLPRQRRAAVAVAAHPR